MSANGPRVISAVVAGAATLTLYRLYRDNQGQANPEQMRVTTDPQSVRPSDLWRHFPRK